MVDGHAARYSCNRSARCPAVSVCIAYHPRLSAYAITVPRDSVYAPSGGAPLARLPSVPIMAGALRVVRWGSIPTAPGLGIVTRRTRGPSATIQRGAGVAAARTLAGGRPPSPDAA